MSATVRGACPRLLAPMQTGDGLLVRLLPAGPIPLKAFAGLCTAAQTHGNSAIEISARGSVQVRGLTPVSAPLFAAAVTALRIDLNEGVPIVSDPLPEDPSSLIDSSGLAAELRQALPAAALRLAPKVSVIVDGGGRLHLDALNADIRVRAVAAANGPLLRMAIAGDEATALPLGAVAPEEACTTVLRLLAAIAAHGPDARAMDALQRGGIDAFRGGIRTSPPFEPSLPRRLPAEMIGTHCLKHDLYALGVGLTFGHAEAGTLRALTDIARTHGGL